MTLGCNTDRDIYYLCDLVDNLSFQKKITSLLFSEIVLPCLFHMHYLWHICHGI